MIAKDIMDWLKKKIRGELFFKVDFSKAYDCVSLNFMMVIVKKMGFISKWF